MRYTITLEDFRSADAPPIQLSVEAASASRAMTGALAQFRARYPSLNLAHYVIQHEVYDVETIQ